MSAYLYIAKIRLINSLAYRFEVFTSVGANMIMMVATFFLWKTAYRGVDSVAGVNEHQMITYTIVSILLASIFSFSVQNVINGRVQQGEIAVDLIRPISLIAFYLFDDLGAVASSLLNKFLPLLVIASLFLQPPLPASLSAGLLFLLSCTLSFGILWLLSALVAMTAFWVMELGNMGIVKDAIIRLLSGSIIPIWFFPKEMQNILAFLPFQYTYQTPISIYVGKLASMEALPALAVQAVWIVILLAVLHLIWKKARKNVLVQGG